MNKSRINRRPLHRHVARGVKLAVVPHKHNDYRPHLVRRYGLLAVLLIVMAIQSFYFTFQDGRVLGDNPSITSSQLLERTNAERRRDSLPTLSLNSQLTAAAHDKAKDMLAVGYWSHNAPDGTTPWQWINDAGYEYADAGENIARGFNTATGIMAAWMDSPSHRANVLDKNFTEVGFAAVNGIMDGHNTTLVVAMYGRPIGAPNAGRVSAMTYAPDTEGSVSLWVHLRRGMRGLVPSLMVTLILLGIVTLVAVLAHVYRRRLPPTLRKSWYRHHALYKITIVASVAVCAILSYGWWGMI
ncbi:CAP domain-containing protein [Candidatus Saccharibacteria bacterium]|nr:CAP domain-containing protein [Candidatus Saccharibacteria bacterium]